MAKHTVNGKEYDVGRLNLFDQFYLVRKLSSVLVFLGQDPEGANMTPEKFGKAFLALTLPLSREDSDSVLRMCMSIVTRQSNGGWQMVIEPNSGLPMFDDVTLETLASLVFHVLEDHNLRKVFSAPPSASGEVQAKPQA